MGVWRERREGRVSSGAETEAGSRAGQSPGGYAAGPMQGVLCGRRVGGKARNERGPGGGLGLAGVCGGRSPAAGMARIVRPEREQAFGAGDMGGPARGVAREAAGAARWGWR